MYIFTYSNAPAPESMTFSRIIKVSTFDELVNELRDSVFCESFKMMCVDSLADNIQDVIQILAAEENVDGTFLNAVQVLFEELDAAQKSQSQERLDACIQLFNTMFDNGNFTYWDFGVKVIGEDNELADFIAGDMGYYCDCREEAEQILTSHIKNWRVEP